MALLPQNDHVMVKLDPKGHFGATEQGAETGIVYAVPEELMYLGFHSFAWENSFAAWEDLKDYLEKYSKLVGRRVYWSSMKERGSVIDVGKDRFAFIKFTDIIADDDGDAEVARNVYGEEGGTFKA